MEKFEENIEFTFSYLALGLLGKNLYSNAWAALSELVANSLDAQSENIFVYIDMRIKNQSIIEVFDDGIGMSKNEMRENYIQVGRNRRKEQGDADSVMGRKGIGKLAALYLSNHYFVASKTAQSKLSIYEMHFPKDLQDSEEKPKMNLVSNFSLNNKSFLKYASGTMIRMENVDLTGYGDVSNSTLNNILGDFFSVNNLGNKKIQLKIVTKDSDESTSFKNVTKMVPFENMVKILCFDDETYERLHKKYSNKIYRIPIRNHVEPYTNLIAVSKEFQKPDNYVIKEKGIVKSANLTGWIGIHSTIDSRDAHENFKKNKLYNPLSLRVYVRNKLAISNFLPVLKNTQIYANYIEGEIGYDILDDNDFDDIATTSRQDMDENDNRVQQLKKNISSVVTQLISSRLQVSKLMKEKKKKLDNISEKVAKNDVYRNMRVAVDNLKNKPDSSDEVIDDVASKLYPTVLQSLKGDMLKKDYKIFFSHASKNHKIIDFFYYLLEEQGVEKSEMFYSSRSDAPQVNPKYDDLEKEIKDNITNTNTAVFFYASQAFMDSEYCMFEGGAVWATRTNQDFYVSFEDFEKIPDYLNRQNEFKLALKDDTDILVGESYLKIVSALNFLIEHINTGRAIRTAPLVKKFDKEDFPNLVRIQAGESPKIDKKIIEFWDAYVQKGALEDANKKGWI